MSKIEREPSAQPLGKLEFEFERRKVSKDDMKELIYREVSYECVFTICFVTGYISVQSHKRIIVVFLFHASRFWNIIQKYSRNIFMEGVQEGSCIPGTEDHHVFVRIRSL